MDQVFSEQLKKALEAGDGPQVKSLVASYLAQDLTDEEEGELYALMLRVYTKAHTQLNANLAEVMGEDIQTLQNLKQTEQAFDDRVQMGNARKTLE